MGSFYDSDWNVLVELRNPADVEKEAGVFQSSASACVHGPGFIARTPEHVMDVVCEIVSVNMQNYKDKIGEQ